MLGWFSDCGVADTDPGRPKEMTAINSGVHEVPGVRLPLQTSYGSPSSHAVFMYSSTGGEGSVTLQLRDADDLDDKNGGLASVLARLQSEDATLSISYQDTEMLTEGSIDVLLGTGALHSTGNGGTTATFDLFDSESGQDLTLSPQTFTSSTEAFINDNSDSLGVPGDTDTVGSTEDNKGAADSSKLTVKKPRPKATSPNRQGPQQCQVCGKVFGNASALAKHKLTHSDERKYVCTMCGKAFKRQDHLNGHMLTHRNKKPYECKAEGCGKSYCDARSLRRHTENHHTNSNATTSTTTTSTVTTAPLAAAATTTTTVSGTGDDVSPAAAAAALASSCIQYAPPPPPVAATSAAAASAAAAAAAAKLPPPPYPASTGAAAAAASTATTVTTATKQPSQLQQLLASEPATLSTSAASSTTKASSTSSSSSSLSNDGLTKQQLDLIHQIMQQTQQQAAAHHKQQQQQQHNSAKTSSNGTAGSGHKSASAAKPRTWNAQSSSVTGSKASSGGSGGGSGGGATPATAGAAATAVTTALGTVKPAPDPKPVECNLCHRKFKNIPALNGHMRLHGGYFKKDSESKKCEKKESSGPPLQTASMSVRALIEEKIIQKRITNPQLSNATQTTQLTFTNSDSNALSRNTLASQYPNLSAAGHKDSDLNIKLSSFVMPAPPVCLTENKVRRHSDSEHFVPPRAPLDVQQEAVALAELLLKRSGKVAVKRASSDPGHQSPQPTQQLSLSFQVSHHPLHHYLQASPGDSYSLAGVTYQAEDGGYFSPSLQDDVLSVQDTMLLHGVDPAQLAETIQFQAASLLHDQTTAEQLQDIASLEDYQSAVQSPHFHQQGHHQDFMPVSLADFTSYAQQAIVTSASASLASPIPKDLSSYQSTNSPLQHHYSNSPHTSLTTQSPLPSPLTHHDSPGYTYPTPPASQEGQSPSFGHMVTSLPMTSPHSDSFGQTVISHGGHVAPVSSPLSAAFYTSTMSSSAAVEAALNEVLPGETMQNGCMLRNLYHPSPPPPQSPLSSTPVPSPLSMSSVPASSSSVSSPLPSNSFNNNQTQMNFPLSPHLQSQMMPNSEDPLLSSSPKDFGSRKKFDFGGIHSFKLVGNGMVDFGVANAGLTGIVVDSNGELKFFQATNHQQAKSIMVANGNNCGVNASVVGNGGIFHKKSEEKVFGPRVTHKSMSHYMQNNSQKCHRSKMQITLDNMKEEADNDIFLSPTSVPASPIRGVSRKRPRPESLYIPPHPQPSYTSRLRSPRNSDVLSTPYTPPPMLSPSRSGQGLFWQAVAPPSISLGNSQAWPSSTTINTNGCSGELSSSDDFHQDYDCAPESDVTPHVNVGHEYQCKIPYWSPNREKVNREPTYEHLLWDPGISKVCTDTEVEMYLEFACCAAVPGGGRNKEYALHLLHMCHGNIHEAMLKLMQPTPALHPGHPLLAYKYAESDRWSSDEMDVFHQGLLKYGKDFRSISQELGTKSIKQCIQFYYLWKKVCPEEYKRLRLIRRRQIADSISRTDYDYDDLKLEDHKHSIPASDVELVSTSSESRLFVCEYHDCSASFNSRAALNGHIRIHGGGGCGRSPTPDKRPTAPGMAGDALEEFPCKICGKVFNKVKSRSAHMKSHRPPDAEPKKPKTEQQSKPDTGDHSTSLCRAPGVTTATARLP